MTSPSKRRWFAFRLRTLLVAVVALGVVLTPLAIKMKKAREQKKAVEWVLENGGSVEYDWQTDDDSGSPPGPKWVRRLVGDEFFQTVRMVCLIATPVSEMSPLRGLTNLRELDIRLTQITAEEVARLQKALPNCKIIR